MKKFLLVSMWLFSQTTFASTGYLFNVAVNGAALGITSVANHTYPNAGIKITSPGFTLAKAGTECKPDANGYCLFSVSPTAPATITVNGSGSMNVTLCLNGTGPMSCQNYDNLAVSGGSTPPTPPTPPQIARGAYVANYSGTPNVSFCAINQATGILQNCQDAGGESVLAGTGPQAIALNNTETIAYIVGDTGNPFAYQCSIGVSGTFTSCSTVNITTPSGYTPEYGQITLNSTNTIAYINDSIKGRILACPIVSGLLSGNCTDTGATNIDSESSTIALNSTNTTAYIAGYESQAVTVCNVSGTSFSGCTLKTGGGSISFSYPGGLALNKTGSILYISDYGNGEVYGCSTTPTGGSTFSNCFLATSGKADAWGITLNATNTFAYIADYNTTVYACPINNDGTFGTCLTNSTFNGPVSLALSY